MNAKEPRPGQLAQSRAGRDRGRYFFVLSVDEKGYALVADGGMRRAENAKRKNLKHLMLLEHEDKVLVRKLSEGAKVSNRDLQKALTEARVGQDEDRGTEDV